ncbi:hypothetical protein WSM22_13040 [Cytophagales bacterium WSM2-2]|nr:hypothetical protein WSM22_13040 [Cytophagales bacterium WSM2-2]
MYSKAFFVLLVVTGVGRLANAQSNWRSPMMGNSSRPVVIFKVDDYITSTNWQTFFNMIESNNVSASVGVIAGWTDDPNHPDGINTIKDKHALYYTNELGDYVSRYEFWDHGYDHDNDQYGVRPQAEQVALFGYAENIFISKMGFESRAFGAPGNALNQYTRPALDEFNNGNNDPLKIWMNYGGNFASIDRGGWNYLTSLDYGPDYSHLLLTISYSDAADDSYQASSNNFRAKFLTGPRPYTLIEMHAAGYTQASVDTLQNFITFLKGRNALFVTPSYLYEKANVERYCGDYYAPASIMAVNSLSAGASLSDDCDHTIVHNGANVAFKAPKIIYLKPGFKSLSGSTFKASIGSTGSSGSRMAAEVPAKTTVHELKMAVYPNPNEGVFVIDFGDKPEQSSAIVIYNMNGKMLRTIDNPSVRETIDLSNEPGGLYLVRVASGTRMNTYKVLKK